MNDNVKKPKALGVHVFAGGFTMGAREHLDVQGQCELHGLGVHTVRQKLRVPFIEGSCWQDWPKHGVQVIYGNPRCTAFSSLSCGSREEVHGHSAKCTQDIWDLCLYGVHVGADVICWESVQQAYTAGRPLIDRLIAEVFSAKSYRIAHVFVTTSALGSCQDRKRYFFVAYRGGEFNVEPPSPPLWHTTVGDCLATYMNRYVNVANTGNKGVPYIEDTCNVLVDNDKVCVPLLREGEGMHDIMDRHYERLPDNYQSRVAFATSNIPFGLHCVHRLKWDGVCPTLHTGCRNWIHPRRDRTLTIRELASLMSWPEDISPIGPKPVEQIVKGVCPEAGAWIADALAKCATGWWGNLNIDRPGKTDVHREDEKVFRYTHIIPELKEAKAC